MSFLSYHIKDMYYQHALSLVDLDHLAAVAFIRSPSPHFCAVLTRSTHLRRVVPPFLSVECISILCGILWR